MDKDNPKYDAMVRAGLVEDDARLAELNDEAKAAAAKKPKKK